jgi:hypothetical protein
MSVDICIDLLIPYPFLAINSTLDPIICVTRDDVQSAGIIYSMTYIIRSLCLLQKFITIHQPYLISSNQMVATTTLASLLVSAFVVSALPTNDNGVQHAFTDDHHKGPINPLKRMPLVANIEQS